MNPKFVCPSCDCTDFNIKIVMNFKDYSTLVCTACDYKIDVRLIYEELDTRATYEKN